MTPLRMPIEDTNDLYRIRKEVGRMVREIGFSQLIQVQICTAVSEIVRNVLLYAQSGGIQARATKEGIMIEVWDNGPGIPLELLAAIEAGTYQSKTGLGKGINGAKKLMDHLQVLSVGKGTQVFMEKHLDK